MRLGDFIRVPDGRIGTVIYNGLEGVGILWGKIRLSQKERDEINGTCPLFGKPQKGWRWNPQAMLRDKKLERLLKIECVGEEKECEVING